MISTLSTGLENTIQMLMRCQDVMVRFPICVTVIRAGKNISDLPCGGCQHCQRLHDHWERFEEDVDDVMPLAVRRIEHETEKHDDIKKHNDIYTGEENRSVSELLGAPHVNWLETTTKEQLAQEQKGDPDLSILHEWKKNGTLPTREQVALKSPAVRKYWLCWPQVELHQGVLFYRWKRPGGLSPALLLLVPVSMQTEVLQACHNPPQSGHLGEGKTLERLRQSFHWYGMGGDVYLYIQRCKHCNACKSAGPTKRAFKITKQGPQWIRSTLISWVRFLCPVLETSMFLSSLTNSLDGWRHFLFQTKAQKQQLEH